MVAGKSSGECVVDEDGCTLAASHLPGRRSYECDGKGDLIPGTGTGSARRLLAPTRPIRIGRSSDRVAALGGQPDGDTTTDGDPAALQERQQRLRARSAGSTWTRTSTISPGEINGPLTTAVDIPDWFQTQPGNPNSVEDELTQYIHTPSSSP